MKLKVTYTPTQEVNELDLELATNPKGEWIIGRSPDCELFLESPDISRIHGKFYVEGGKYYFCDLGSRNGSIINQKLAEKNQPYILQHDDSIQIGDYILMLEEIKPAAEQLPETVFRFIDPALFSRPISDNVNVANNTNQAAEVVSEFSGEVITPTQEEEASSENQQVITTPESPIGEEKTFVQPEDITLPPPAIVTLQDVDLSTPIAEESTFVQPEDITLPPPAIVTLQDVDLSTPIAEESTFVQPEDITLPPQDIVTDVATTDSDEDVDLSPPILQEFTTVQPRDINLQVYPTDTEQDVDLIPPILQEFTTVQPRDINLQASPSDRDEAVDVDTADADGIETLEVVSGVEQEATTDIDTATEDSYIETSDTVSEAQEVVSNVPEVVNESQAEVITAPLDNNINTQIEDTEVFSDEYAGFSSTSSTVANVVFTPENLEIAASISTAEESDTSELVGETSEAIAEVEETAEESDTSELVGETSQAIAEVEETTEENDTSELVGETSQAIAEVEETTEESDTSELVGETSEAIAEVEETTEESDTSELVGGTSEAIAEVEETTEESDTSELVGETSEAIAEVEEVEVVDNVEADTESEPSQMSIQKNIILIAHETKKSELAELVAQHQEFFSESLTISWPSVSAVLKQQADLTVSEEIPPPTSGGYQKINLMLNSGDVLAVIFLRDLLTPQPGQANEEALLRICNINQVLVATNLATAKAIIHYLKYITE